MTRKEVLLATWDMSVSTERWFAPLDKALKGADLDEAEWLHESEGFNSIKEIVCHLIYYKERFLSRLEMSQHNALPTNEATFRQGELVKLQWHELLERLTMANANIRQHILQLDEESLDKPLPKAPIGAQLLDLAVHDAYHSGQIVLIRKLQGRWGNK